MMSNQKFVVGDKVTFDNDTVYKVTSVSNGSARILNSETYLERYVSLDHLKHADPLLAAAHTKEVDLNARVKATPIDSSANPIDSSQEKIQIGDLVTIPSFGSYTFEVIGVYGNALWVHDQDGECETIDRTEATKVKPHQEIWLNIYEKKDGIEIGSTWKSREKADKWADPGRFMLVCIKSDGTVETAPV